jgi:hypothetical protein
VLRCVKHGVCIRCLRGVVPCALCTECKAGTECVVFWVCVARVDSLILVVDSALPGGGGIRRQGRMPQVGTESVGGV